MFDVKENKIQNEQIWKKLDTYSLTQIMEMRRAKWLEKLAHMPPTKTPENSLSHGYMHQDR